MKSHSRWSRRTLLRSLGVSAAAAPFIPLLDGHADDPALPKRLILFTHPNGVVLENWRPSGGEHDFVLSPILAPLAAYRDRMLVLDGIDLGHAMDVGHSDLGHGGLASLWTGTSPIWQDQALEDGWASGPSVDQVVASAIGGETAFASLQTGVTTVRSDAFIHTRAYYAGAQQPLDCENDPRAVFDRLFGDFSAEPGAVQRRIDARRSVMDTVRADVAALQPKLSPSDRQRLDEHLTGIEELEKRLDDVLPPSCDVPDAPADIDYESADNLEAITDSQIDLVVRALACDRTRVAGFQWGREASCGSAPWIGSGGIHTRSHEITPESLEYRTNLATWFASKLARLVDGLAAANALENTLIVWGSPMAVADLHTSWNMPMVVIDGTGYFNAGRYLRWGSYEGGYTASTGVSSNKLMVSICHAMGLTDVESFGNLQNPDLMTGPLDGLT
jgi:Protein of unknown function (DUF1552)